eukprot:229063-Heterocapsa_arctica.AAC.1
MSQFCPMAQPTMSQSVCSSASANSMASGSRCTAADTSSWSPWRSGAANCRARPFCATAAWSTS